MMINQLTVFRLARLVLRGVMPLYAAEEGNAGGENESAVIEDSPSQGWSDGDEGGDGRTPPDLMDYAAEEWSFNDRLRHYMRSSSINQNTRQPVEFTLMVEAGAYVTEQEAMPAHERNAKMLRRYRDLIRDIPDEYFSDLRLKSQMKDRYYQGQRDFDGARLWDKYKDVIQQVRNKYINILPNNLANLPSGTSISEHYNSFVLAKYREANVSSLIAY